MSWPIPAPGDISDRYSSALELALGVDANGKPRAVDARSTNKVLGVMARTHGEVQFEEYLFQANQAKELFPDTAVQELAHHASIWGVPRIAAKAAIGPVTFTATTTSDVSIPAGTVLYTGQLYWVVTATIDVPAGGSAVAQVEARAAGASGNLAAGTILSLLSPIAGLTLQSATVGAGGLAGGADIQSVDDWQAAIVAKIRQPPSGGALADYVTWAKQAGASYVGVQPNWMGLGTVGVIIAMAGPRAPTTDEIAAVQAYIDGPTIRPVTAQVFVIGAVLTTVPMQAVLNPDTAAARIAVQNAVDLFYLSDQFAAAIEGTVYKSRLSDAISAVTGETSHRIYLPAADVTVTATQMPITSAITWTAPS